MGAPSVPVVVPYSRGYGVFDILTNLGNPIGTDLNGQPTSWVDFRVELERPGALGVGNITGGFPISAPGPTLPSWSSRMAFRWFTIEKISRLEKRSKSDDDRFASNWRSWSQGFIVDITIKSGRDHHVRVDAFPLLYEFLNAVVSFCTKRQFDLEIGEGIALQGAL